MDVAIARNPSPNRTQLEKAANEDQPAADPGMANMLSFPFQPGVSPLERPSSYQVMLHPARSRAGFSRGEALCFTMAIEGLSMRRIVIAFGLSAIVALGANSSAAAADMPVKAYGPVARAYDWTGFYLGADVGGARSNTSWTLLADQTTFADFPPGGPGSWVASHRLSGWVGGGHLGYQKQYGHVVLGAELSLLALSLAGNAPSVQEAMDDQYSTEVNDLILAGARIGYAWNNNLLAYLKGGLASASVRTRIVDAVGTSTGIWESKERHNGWNIGAGVELAGRAT